MGVKNNIKHDSFPKQGSLVGKPIKVAFHYDTTNVVDAVCVRDDAEAPHQMIFQLSDGRIVLATECQYQPA